MSRQQLLADIASVLSGTANYVNGTAATWDVYEIYFWSLLVKAARELTNDVYFENCDSTRVNNLVFRTSPGVIVPAAKTAPRYTHAVVRNLGRPVLEIHQGIYVSGRSALLHECDWAVITREEGEACRRRQGASPRHGSVILAGECKYYSGGPSISLAREFLGLTIEIGGEGRYFLHNHARHEIDTFFQHHKRVSFLGAVPGNPQIIEEATHIFRKGLRDFLLAS